MWDSGFVALGTSTYNLEMSLAEIEKMFSGQWENGMLPHILFHSEKEKTYFPNYDFWNSKVNNGAPQSPKSSGITQPAVFGFIVHDILKNHWGNQVVQSFAKRTFGKIVKYHRFLYNYRDPYNEGLFFIYHPCLIYETIWYRILFFILLTRAMSLVLAIQALIFHWQFLSYKIFDLYLYSFFFLYLIMQD